MEIIGKVVKVGDSLMITIPHKVCADMKIIKGNHIVVDIKKKVRK